MVEVCDPRLIGLDLLTTSECMIDLGRGVLWVGLEELPLRDVNMDERAELGALGPLTILSWWTMVDPLLGP